VAGFYYIYVVRLEQQQAAGIPTNMEGSLAISLTKGSFAISLSRFFNLLYKNGCFRKMKSILTFPKWTKINVQKLVSKNILTDRKIQI